MESARLGRLTVWAGLVGCVPANARWLVKVRLRIGKVLHRPKLLMGMRTVRLRVFIPNKPGSSCNPLLSISAINNICDAAVGAVKHERVSEAMGDELGRILDNNH